MDTGSPTDVAAGSYAGVLQAAAMAALKYVESIDDRPAVPDSAATTIAERLHAGGLTILNDVVLNQVLVRMVDGPTTEALVAEIQFDGRIWCGPTQ